MNTLLLLALTACSGEAPEAAAPPAPETTETPATAEDNHEELNAHGAVAAEPGSHEDWCGEHQVPESQCTRCDASLIPAFQATDDWCAEHSLPETQCLECNPDLTIERPPEGS